MLELGLIAVLFISVIVAMAVFKKLRRPMLFTGLAVLFFPFGVLVAMGWILPKAIQLVLPYLPLKDIIS